MDVHAQEAHAEMIITVTRPDGSTQTAKFVSVESQTVDSNLITKIEKKEQ